jgi:hypothetical protein
LDLHLWYQLRHYSKTDLLPRRVQISELSTTTIPVYYDWSQMEVTT